jgi:hypothetical protein
MPDVVDTTKVTIISRASPRSGALATLKGDGPTNPARPFAEPARPLKRSHPRARQQPQSREDRP